MVWWTYSSLCKLGPWTGFTTAPDVIYQSINVILDCHNSTSNAYHYHSLINVGVNIFNVDLTIHDLKFLDLIKEGIVGSEAILKKYPTGYYRPVGLSVTMSVNKPLEEINDRVDIIILKDITKAEQLFEFRKRNKKFSSMPILSWPPNLGIEDLNELIKMSSGFVLDQDFSDGDCGIVHVLQTAKLANKPVFHFNPNIIHEYYDHMYPMQLRRILAYSHNIVTYGLEGYILVDSVGKVPKYVVQAMVKATKIAEREVQTPDKLMKRSYETPLPALAPTACAFGASLAALKCGANCILVWTMSGASARVLSFTLPPCHIIAITPRETTARRMHLYKKVLPLLYNEKREASWHAERTARVVFGTQFGLEIGLYDYTAKLVVLSPLQEGAGYCNGFQIVEVSDILASKCCR